MSYTPNVPQANQKIAATQAPIEANFTWISTTLNVDHTFYANQLAGEPFGSHQKISSPNRPDIVGALPAGIGAIMYANAGNFYNYNGVKNAMSAVNQSATALAITASPLTVLTVPNESIGFIMGIAANQLTRFNVYGFMSLAGTLYVVKVDTALAGWTATASGLNLQVNGSTNTTFAYKAIYWPI